MVGFNRRFAPRYMKAKEKMDDVASIKVEKHRVNGVGRNVAFTIMDDYIHLVDTVRWFADGDLKVVHHHMGTNEHDQLIHAQHLYTNGKGAMYATAMHRRAGTNLEQLELVMDGAIVRVKNMTLMEEERNGAVIASNSGSWEPVTKLRGFEGAVNHFITSIQQDTNPEPDAQEGLKTQLAAESLLSGNPRFE